MAQIGEFSFILAEFGVAFRLLPVEGRDLILAGALLSIVLNPLVLMAAGSPRPGCDAARRPGAAGEAGRPARGRAPRCGPPKWRRHAVVVGYGRVGGPIGRALSEQGLPFIIVESNRWRAEGSSAGAADRLG